MARAATDLTPATGKRLLRRPPRCPPGPMPGTRKGASEARGGPFCWTVEWDSPSQKPLLLTLSQRGDSKRSSASCLVWAPLLTRQCP